MQTRSKFEQLFLAFLPTSAFAHGGGLTSETWWALLAIVVAMALTITAIIKSRWSAKGKALLLTTYLVSIVITQLYFWALLSHLLLVTACLIFIPIIVVAVNFYLFDKYFRARK
jgi:hypothetical protein